ncbi:VOC family protein [bacterium]|nr:VOC family protein [bacterium]
MPGIQGLPCWYELGTSNLEAAKAFYGAILGWSVADSGMPGMTYLLASAGAVMVAGMMRAEAPQPVAWSIYFAVESADATVAAAEALGARVHVPPSDIPNTGRFAVLADPQGAGFAILQPLPGGDGGAFDLRKPGHGNWNELITPDPAAALAFYGKLFGWAETRAVPMGPEMTYHIFAHDGQDIGGTCALPGAPAQWKPYFGVPSVKAAAEAVTRAGGRVLHGPDQVPGGSFTLQIADPQGAAVALVGPA